MKKIHALIILCLFFATAINAQSSAPQTSSFALLNINNVIQGDASVFQYEATVDVKNISGSTKNVVMFKKINNLAPNHKSLFCWGINCYGETTDTATYLEVMPSDSISLGREDIRTYFNPGISTVTYCWYDSANPVDSVCLEFTYDITTTGIHEVYNSTTDFATMPYPNPADLSTSITYHLNNHAAVSKLVFYNVIGAKVYEVALDYSKQNILINTSSFQSGVYYYALMSGDKSISTRKLIVSHKN